MKGHLFVTQGDLLHLACDAVLIPSGTDPRSHDPRSTQARGHFVRPWSALGVQDMPGGTDALGKIRRGRVRVAQVSRRSGSAPAIWVGHTGEGGRDPNWYAAAVSEFVEKAGRRRGRELRPLGDDRPLLAVPLVGTGSGGYAAWKGDVVKAIVRQILDSLEMVESDVVLVLKGSASYAAVQQARLRYGEERLWSALSSAQLEVIQRLTDEAIAGRLVLFMGAGTGIGAGLPSWRELLDFLAHEVGLTSSADRGQLAVLDPRDAAAIIERRFDGLGRDLSDELVTRFTGDRISLVHQLLASLPVREALTTNYDQLFERAWRDAGRRPTVLPESGTARGGEWLLKLHGSVSDRKRLVLSRGDYLRLEEEGAALAGMVHAVLLTRHLLFVGYSLSDDNFHRIVHQVRTTVRAATDTGTELGTVLTPDHPKLIHEVWEPDLRLCPTATGGRSENPVRRLAILLDRLGAETAAIGHLLDRSFETVFRPEELELRDHLARAGSIAADDRVRPALRRAVRAMLAQLGGKS